MNRRQRGIHTQYLLAKRWRRIRIFPKAKSSNAGSSDDDILNTPGLLAEVKARTRTSILSVLQKVRAKAKLRGLLGIVVWRHNGQGEKLMSEWTVHMALEDFEELWRKAHG